ncbi:hypothetical protein D7W82_27770 [Corallococcus sp. CA049B]|uniref:hypothetical protein n=1 Tax=Corallococcus sp. CA049B TaxID=2316730 RepID=UPI000EA09BF5|nr:hypothetical protein [Corallococcus sp. CA049B]RKG81638.1 hypothetical protein D7W82_27770 [Corallococcus sp. CA049B]
MGTRKQREEAAGLGIEGLVALELKAIERRPGRAQGGAAPSDGRIAWEPTVRPDGDSAPTWIEHPHDDLFGLALSGGGIRSATFNLGLLQGLEKLKLLGVFHYLSTVSGGGYVGSFWTAWRARAGLRADPGAEPHPLKEPPAFPDSPSTLGLAEPDPVHHLRLFSNFLRPRPGLLNSDSGRMVSSVVNATIPSLLATLALLTLGVLGWEFLARGIMTGDRGLVLLAVLTSVELLVGEVAWRGLEVSGDRDSRSLEGSWAYVLAALFAVGMTLGLEWLFARGHAGALMAMSNMLGWRRMQTLAPPSGPMLRALFSPAAVWMASAGALVLLRFLFSRLGRSTQQPAWTYAFGRVISRLFLLAALWAGIALCWLGGAWIGEDWFHSVGVQSLFVAGGPVLAGFLMAVLTRLQKRFTLEPSRPSVPGKRARARPVAIPLLSAVVVVLFLIGVMALVSHARTQGQLLPLFLLAAGITVATLFCFDTTRMGLHHFYRSRLARAYLGASLPDSGRAEPASERRTDDLPLTALNHSVPARPLHLICCAANDLRPKDSMRNLGRGAQSAVLSAVGMSVAHEAAGWTSEGTSRREGGAPSLGAAMTASGAAFNSNMGAYSKRLGAAFTFLMTAFNFRLGLWWPHPTRGRGHYFEWAVGLPFFKEMFGMSRAQGRDVHLSDGGHFENLALYELVRRHCRYILVSDCGRDPDLAFDDFGNAVRRVREDFGVDIRIDLSPLRPGPDGLARQPMVAGDIHYPTGDTGVLLMIRPTLMGNEPADVTQYKTRNAAFPHESTGDQFYDEAQWEAYRRLGEHEAELAFQPILRQLDVKVEHPGQGARFFAQARREWLPLPAGYSERFERFASRAAEIDTLLHASGAHRLLREVFEEEQYLEELVPLARLRQGVPVRPSHSPRPRDITLSLQACRRALLFMEEVFLCEKLDETHNHPAYLGLMNYFARWTQAPLFRLWWPLLKTLYPQRFARFLEAQFDLTSGRDGGHVEDVDGKQHPGLAMSAWMQKKRVPPMGDGARLLSFKHPVRYDGQRSHDIQLALVRARCGEDAAGGLLAWDEGDFFVPPGFWGNGIGEAFLNSLNTWAKDPKKGVSRLAVHIQGEQQASAAEKKRQADAAVLYRSSGFSAPDEAERKKLCRWWSFSRSASQDCADGECACLWLVREVPPANITEQGHPHHAEALHDEVSSHLS